MKRFICLTLALMLACTCILTLSSCGNKSGDKVIKIGVYEPASGSNGPGGKQETLGVIYAHSIQNTIEIGGETYKIELVEVDNQSDNAKGITAASELVNKGVSVVLGSYGSGVSIAASPTFEEAGVAAIGITFEEC